MLRRAILFLLPSLAMALSVDDVKLSQATTVTPFPAYADRFISPTVQSLWGFDSSKRPVNIILGTNLSMTGTTLNATGGGGGSPGGTPGQIQYNNSGSFGGFTMSGDGAQNASTGVFTLATSGVSAGSYTNTSLTVDAKGRITAASNGSPGGVTSVTASLPLTSSGGTTPNVAIPAATSSANGYLSSSDWSAFNAKQPAGSYLTAVTADAPISGFGTSGSHLVISQSGTGTNGYLSSTDWNTFNAKAPSGSYITALTGDGSASGPGSVVFTLASVASSGTTGGSTAIPVITINAKGLTTGITTAAVVAPAGTLTGGTLASNVLASSLTSVGTIATGVWQGTAIADTYIASAATWNAKQPAGNYITALTGDVAASGPGSVVATLATVNTNVGSFGSATQVGIFTVNAKGLTTAAANVTVTPALSSLIAATGSNTIASGNNTEQVWNWANTANSTVAMALGETTAATNGTSTSGVPNQVLFKLSTLASSTESPLSVYSRGAHVFSVSPSTRQILATSGDATNPPYSFSASTSSGLYYNPTYQSISVSRIGSELIRLGGSSAVGTLAVANNPSYLFSTGVSTQNAIISSASNAGDVIQYRSGYGDNADKTSPDFSAFRSRGDLSAPTAVSAGDVLGTYAGQGYIGTTNQFRQAASIKFLATGTIADSTTGIGGQIKFYTTLAGTDTSPQLGGTMQGGSIPTFTASGSISPSGSAVTWTAGAGSPETVVTAPVGSLYSRTDGGAGTSLYVKESGAGNTGWIGK